MTFPVSFRPSRPGAPEEDPTTYSIEDLERSWAIFFLRLYHAWVFFIASVVLGGYGLNTFLSMFLQFTNKLNQRHQVVEGKDWIQLVRLLTRAFLLVLLWAGAVQRGVWLFLDSFSKDMFLSYRRVLCCEGVGPTAWFEQTVKVQINNEEDLEQLCDALTPQQVSPQASPQASPAAGGPPAALGPPQAAEPAAAAAAAGTGEQRQPPAAKVERQVTINGVILYRGWELVLTTDDDSGRHVDPHELLRSVNVPCFFSISTGSRSIRTAAFEGSDQRGRLRAYWDVICQCLIFLTLDVYPFVKTFWSLPFESLVTFTVITTLASNSIAVAFVHIAIYMLFSTSVDYYWKVCSWAVMTAELHVDVLPWVPQCLRQWHTRALRLRAETDQTPLDAEQPEQSGIRRLRAVTEGAVRNVQMLTGALGRNRATARFAPLGGDDLNLFVRLRKSTGSSRFYLGVLAWSGGCFLLLLISVAMPRGGPLRRRFEVSLGLCCFVPLLLLGLSWFSAACRRSDEKPTAASPDGEEHNQRLRMNCFRDNCGLRPRSVAFGCISKLLLGTGIAAFSYWKDIRGCVVFGMLLATWNLFIVIFVCRWRDRLWVVSLAQTMLFGLCALLSAVFGRIEDLIGSGYDSTLVLIFFTQLGNWRMGWTKTFSCLKAFYVSMAFVIALLTMLSHSWDTGMVFGKPKLEFCLPHQIAAGKCTPVDFPLNGFKEPYEFCGMSWPMGSNDTDGLAGTVSDRCEDDHLSIADFGQLAAVAGYLPNMTRVHMVLHHNLPGWKPAFHQVYNLSSGNFTTFLDMRRGHTIVVAVRGTSSLVEALQDVNLWMPIAFLQISRSMGPSLYSTRSVLQTLMLGHRDLRSESFNDLAEYMRNLHAKYSTTHRIYMTGHSLGGGLAAAVGTKLRIPAITFSAPGLGATSAILSPKVEEESLIRYTVNVVPDKDLVPQVDMQTGTVFHTRCPIHSPFGCHRLKVTMCEILAACGDGGGRPVPRGFQRSCETCGHDAGLHLPGCPHPGPHPRPREPVDPADIVGPGPYIGPGLRGM